MAVLSSLFAKHKCKRVYDRDDKFCVYFADILLCVVIILLLIPQILVVSVMELSIENTHELSAAQALYYDRRCS